VRRRYRPFGCDEDGSGGRKVTRSLLGCCLHVRCKQQNDTQCNGHNSKTLRVHCDFSFQSVSFHTERPGRAVPGFSARLHAVRPCWYGYGPSDPPCSGVLRAIAVMNPCLPRNPRETVHQANEYLRCFSRKRSMASQRHSASRRHSRNNVICAKITANSRERRESSPSADRTARICPPGIALLHPSCLPCSLPCYTDVRRAVCSACHDECNKLSGHKQSPFLDSRLCMTVRGNDVVAGVFHLCATTVRNALTRKCRDRLARFL